MRDARDAKPSHSPQPTAYSLSPRGFTLPELLVVITIIAILLGLLYSAIKTVARYSRETITKSELVNIEAALKQYYAYYHCWPTNVVEQADVPQTTAWKDGPDSFGDLQYEIRPALARMLEGNTNTTTTAKANPDGVVFLELTRFDDFVAPINAWGKARGQRYCVKFDSSGDNIIYVPKSVGANDTTSLFRSVGVWTVNPDKNSIIGSWQQ